MDDLRPVQRVFGAGVLATFPGALACAAYSWLWLIAHDPDYLYVLQYEPFLLPTCGGIGAVVGFAAGLWVGWRLRTPRLAALRLGGRSAAGRLLWSACQGAWAGAGAAHLAATALALASTGRYDARYLVQVDAAGAVVGWFAAVPLPGLLGIARSQP